LQLEIEQTQTIYSWDKKIWQFKSPKNFRVRTRYFWQAEKFLWNISVVCLNVPYYRHLRLPIDTGSILAV
jgi:hypothetical protein